MKYIPKTSNETQLMIHQDTSETQHLHHIPKKNGGKKQPIHKNLLFSVPMSPTVCDIQCPVKVHA